MPAVDAGDIVVRTPYVSDTAQLGDTLGHIDEILVAPGDSVQVSRRP